MGEVGLPQVDSAPVEAGLIQAHVGKGMAGSRLSGAKGRTLSPRRTVFIDQLLEASGFVESSPRTPRARVLRIPVGENPESAPRCSPGTAPRTQAGITTVVRSPHASACVRGAVSGGLFEVLGFLETPRMAGSREWLNEPTSSGGLS